MVLLIELAIGCFVLVGCFMLAVIGKMLLNEVTKPKHVEKETDKTDKSA